MIFIPDANVLIQAARWDAEYFDACHSWITGALRKGEVVTAPYLVEIALLRITTMPSMPGGASRINDPFNFLVTLRQAGYQRLEPGVRFNEIFESLCIDHHIYGNDVNDAFLAALALENNATLVSMDKGFARFPISWFDPSA